MKQVITKTSEQYQLEQKMKCCPECGAKADKDFTYPLVGCGYYEIYYNCPNEECGCQWKVVEDELELPEKANIVLPPEPPMPPFRIMGTFGETKESKKARAKYEEDLKEWKKEMEFWKKTYGSAYYVSIY